MASDVIFDEHLLCDSHTSTSQDLFMTEGMMNPKELYITDLSSCPKDGSSSSDSGISNLDDLPDIANVTDLNAFIDADFKDLDLSLDFTIAKADVDVAFDPEFFVKAEPLSPSSHNSAESGSDDPCLQDPVSPDFYTLCDDVNLNLLPSLHHQNEEIFSLPQPNFLHDQSFIQSPDSPSSSFHSSPSSPSSPGSTILSPSATILQHTVVQQQQSYSHQLQQQMDQSSSPLSQLQSPHHTNIIVVPQIKKEVSPSPPQTVSIVNTTGVLVSKPNSALNLNAILSSNVKIQPKPDLDTTTSKGNSTTWLTTATSQVPLSSQPISVGAVINSAPLVTSKGIASLADEKSMKRAQRIIKNRESASLSRKRKKEYMSSLEDRLRACRDENERLFRENELLKQKVTVLQNENTQLKTPAGFSPAKKICLMCVAVLLTLNLSSFSFGTVDNFKTAPSTFDPTQHSGRHLLSVGSDFQEAKRQGHSWLDKNVAWSRFDEEIGQLVQKMNLTGKLGTMCPMYFNSTESLRLAEQLTGWMVRQEEEKKKKEEKKMWRKKKRYPPVRRFNSASLNSHATLHNARQISPHRLRDSDYPVQIFKGADPRQQMLNAIPRRNDTFYVLSFSTDYYLLPATAHNKTMRPRMSLLMPLITAGLNESNGRSEDRVDMMQIDCEILNTNLIQVRRSGFPQYSASNSTSSGQNETGNNNSTNHTSRGNTEEKYWEKLGKSWK